MARDLKIYRRWQISDLSPVIQKPILFCAAVLLLIFLALLQACTKTSIETAADNTGLVKTYAEGVAVLNQKISRTEITVADQLEIVLEASAPENTDVEFPNYSASLGDFTLKETKIHPARMSGNGENIRVIYEATYLLEPYLPGDYTIPAMKVIFSHGGNGAKNTALATEKIEIIVKSLLGQDTGHSQIKDIRGPLALPGNTGIKIVVSALLLLLVILGVAGFLFWQKKHRSWKPVEVNLPPEEIALKQLEMLLAENLLSRGEIKLFHRKISDILRHYIENRFGIRAPERTTEEFLTELSPAGPRKHSLLDSQKALLADFLSQCDLVKFAKHEPSLGECEKTVKICREFIEETKEERFQGV